MWEIPRDYWCGLHFAGIHLSAWQNFIHVQPLKYSKTICRVEEKVRPKKNNISRSASSESSTSSSISPKEQLRAEMQSLGYVVLQNRQSVHFSKWSFKICRSTTVHTGSSVSSFSEDDSAESSSLFFIETSILRRLAPAITELVEGTSSSSRINAACSNQLPLSLSARFLSCPSSNCFFFLFLGPGFFVDWPRDSFLYLIYP